MAKSIKNIKQRKTEKENFLSKFSLDEILPQKYHLTAVVLVIIILFLAFLNPLYFGGKTFESGDIISSKSMEPYINNHTDGFTLWNPLIFCGMPAYALGTSDAWFNVIATVYTKFRSLFTDLFAVQYTTWTFFLILLAVNSFLLMKYLTKNTLVSLFVAVATSFSTGIIVFLFIGHVTKLTGLSMYPAIFLLLLRMKEKIRLIDFLILIIVIQLMLQGFHAQIIFYIFFAVALYLIFFLIRSLIKKEKDSTINILKSTGLFIAASVIALLIQADNITQIYEYTPYSTRGTASIVEKNANNEDNSSSGYYEYHTMWSFSPGEVLTFIVPSYYGFGNSTYQGPLTQGQEYNANTYIGQIESVDVAMYMGVLIFILGLFAILTMWKDPFVKFLTLLSALALLISFGKNFPLVFDFLFYHLPYFNKFRVPIMILVLVQMSFPILAGFGLMKIISLRTLKDNRTIKIIKNVSIVFSIIFVLTLVLKGPFADWFTGRINDYVALNPKRTDLTALSSYASDMFTGDLITAFAILSAAFWAAFAYINSKIGKDILVASIIILTVFDLFRIDSRGEKYINNPDITNMFNPPDYVTAIKNQNDKNPFRMINIKQDGSLGSYNVNSNANFNAYFMLEDFAGYSGIKPRAYQDLMDVIGPVNPTLWRMLNVKYIVADQQIPYPGFVPVMQKGKEIVYRNDQALPRAYFVNKVVSEPDLQVLDDIKANKFDPKNIAFVESSAPKVDPPDSTASISFTEYKDETIALSVNATGSNFLFLGDTYLPTGWKASIDGNKTEIYKVNHGFMGIIVPKGKHTVVFNYNPRSFVLSKYLVLSLSSLTLLGLLLGLFIEFKKKRTGNLAGETSGDKR